MALIVEDGTRPTGSNCYISVADADAYHLARGGTAWAEATTGVKEAAILEATCWLNGQIWKGRKVVSRTMAWPRADVVDGDGWPIATDTVPEVVGMACAELAGEIVAGSDPLAVQDRAMSEMSVGPISISYEQGAAKAPTFPAVTALLRGLVYGSGTIRLVR